VVRFKGGNKKERSEAGGTHKLEEDNERH